MNNSDPRPMPPEVQRAYHDPLELAHLLASHAYSDKDRLEIRDQLLSALVDRFGEVEVFVGDKGRTQKVSARVRSFKKNWVGAIEFMLDVENFGGREVTLPMLARLMEPRWQSWWANFRQTPFRRVGVNRTWAEVAVWVLGERQIRWMAAQLARTVIPFVEQEDVDFVLPMIETVESYCVRPFNETRQRMLEEHEALGGYLVRTVVEYERSRATTQPQDRRAAYDRSLARQRFIERTLSSNGPSAICVMIPTLYGRHERHFNWMREDLAKQFFAPSLITDPSRGLR